MNRHKPIAADEVSRAIQAFIRKGGIIHRLADARTPRLAVVGARYGQFENPREQLFGGTAYFAG
jgi:hypothetical protein